MARNRQAIFHGSCIEEAKEEEEEESEEEEEEGKTDWQAEIRTCLGNTGGR